MIFPFLYMILAIDKLNGRGLSNTACREYLPKKTKLIATEGLPGSSNKSECLSYKGEWADA